MTSLASFKQIDFQTADDLWESLSPTRNLDLQKPYNLIYRGQGNSDWKLIPYALRDNHINKSVVRQYNNEHKQANGLVRDELFNLIQFVKHCDRTGIKIPNDTKAFREDLMNLHSPVNNNFITNPSSWPNRDYLELMALAQHHGVPTRLLDWTSLPYTACYFAASSAVSNYQEWDENSQLAIWVINKNAIVAEDLYYVFKAPGSISPHLAAQYGSFTVHPHNGAYRKPYQIFGLEELSIPKETPNIFKLTLPSFEAGRLLLLCNHSGFSAADIYPSADGAGKAVNDDRNIQAALCHFKEKGLKLSFFERKII
ncbi:TPA: FRG domain-containing protein [Salmonella enterica]|nr:hypothetical protein [Salmonella enterica subsp. enterica serovar Bredeney]ECS5737067.1 FRG domain-containing protein [Salmonella enterica subsp. enterica serovar Lika]EHS9641214.1 FRG domain-containing protein [Salmonella enterica]EBW2496051.1 FRG domain-containing protein [Salmonella enterica subsp. enterica serovar Bredeney]ECB3282057.1 FRG domain-containing protein [Salmonella enterica subsp. enterica serovar Bredeney]